MKNILILSLLMASFTGICQQKLSGIYTEYKRTLWNNEDGSKFTINSKPFEPDMQFDFIGDSVVIYNGSKKSTEKYTVNGDTLIFSFTLGMGANTKRIFTKYIIMENKKELTLREFKEGLNKDYYLKKYYFKKSDTFQQDYFSKNKPIVYTLVKEMPDFPGGSIEMRKFVADEVQKSKLKGSEKIFVKLLINPEGKIEDVQFLINPKIEYAEEALKILRKFPKFTPGKQNDLPVYVYYNLPIKFTN